MNFPRRIFGVAFALMAAALVFTGGTSRAVEAAAPDFFPVMAWNSVPNDPAVLKKMKECGLTVAGFVAPGTLDACQAAGLKAIVSDARTSGYDWTKVDEAAARSNVTSVVKETGAHPAVYGYYLREEMGAAARKYHLPFWNIVLSVGHFSYREPTAADFKFQVYSSLAYGAKGIAYFTYFAPAVGNYRMAPIDQFGNETANWQNMRYVN